MNTQTPLTTPKAFDNEFQLKLAELVQQHQTEHVRKLISEKNILHYHHGHTWAHPADESIEEGRMEEHRAEIAYTGDQIRSGDLAVLATLIDSMVKQTAEQFYTSTFEMLDDACERSGNTVSASKEGGLAAAFEKMLEKIEFSVNEAGEVELPTIHTGAPIEDFRILEEQEPEFKERIDLLIKKKSESAIERDRLRRKRFKGVE